MFPASGWVGDWKLRVAVDGDARQVVPDDLVNCKGTEEKTQSVVTRLLMSLTWIKAIVQIVFRQTVLVYNSGTSQNLS